MTAVVILAVGLAFASPARASKVEEVKRAVKDKCSSEIPQKELLDAVVKAYDCQPKSDVTISGCTIKCMKGDSGNVVGGR
jgi:ABC-type proline/glycine betaine transport system substrate-binding protein